MAVAAPTAPQAGTAGTAATAKATEPAAAAARVASRAQPQRRGLQGERDQRGEDHGRQRRRERRGRVDVGGPEDDGHHQVDGEHAEQRGRQHDGEQGSGEPAQCGFRGARGRAANGSGRPAPSMSRLASRSAAACRAVSAGRVTTKTCATAYVAASATPIATAAWPVSSSRAQQGRRQHAAALHELRQRTGRRRRQPEPGGTRRQVHRCARGGAPERRRGRQGEREPRAARDGDPGDRAAHPGRGVERHHRRDQHGVLHRVPRGPGRGAPEPEVGLQCERRGDVERERQQHPRGRRRRNAAGGRQHGGDRGEQCEGRDPVAGEPQGERPGQGRPPLRRRGRDVAGEQRRPAQGQRDGADGDQRQHDRQPPVVGGSEQAGDDGGEQDERHGLRQPCPRHRRRRGGAGRPPTADPRTGGAVAVPSRTRSGKAVLTHGCGPYPRRRQPPTPASAPLTVRPPGTSTYASRASGEVNAYTRRYGSTGPTVGSASTDCERGTCA